MAKEHAIELLRTQYSREDVQSYIEQAEELEGVEYWALIPDDEALLADMTRYLLARQLEAPHANPVH